MRGSRLCYGVHRYLPSRPVAKLLATGRQRPKRRQVGALHIRLCQSDKEASVVLS
jgi:hypothetical protein